MLIDTHCHLYSEEFENDIEETLKRAEKNSINKIILPNIDNDSVQKMNKLCESHEGFLYPTLGLHPTSVNKNYKTELNSIFSNDINKIVAIGEIGIDLYWDKTYFKLQQDAFDYQLNFASENNLPVIIHSRNSMDEVFEILNSYKDKKLTGVFHCYPGDYEQARKVIDFGFFLGIGGVLTYKKSDLPNIIYKIPIEHIVLETDAPYLSPVPFRGKRNEPSYIKNIAEKVAEIKNKKYDEVCYSTTLSAYSLFKKIK